MRQGLLVDGAVNMLRESFRDVMKQKPFTIDAIVVLPDHLHCLWQLPPGDADFSTRWKMIKTHFTKQYKRRISELTTAPRTPSMQKKHESGLWQRRFWEHTIRNETDYQNHFDYIHYNPVKHGLAKTPADWKYSSFHRYVNNGVYELDWATAPTLTFDNIIGDKTLTWKEGKIHGFR